MIQHLEPSRLTPPHKVVRPEQVDELAESLARDGWCGDALVGYHWQNGIQLLSGTHRHAAAARLNLHVPVVVHSYDTVEAAWGQSTWATLMASGQVDA